MILFTAALALRSRGLVIGSREEKKEEKKEEKEEKTHPRPLQRARKRYKERTGSSPWENRHSGADHDLSDLIREALQVVNSEDPDPISSACPPHVPGVERWNHPDEACSVDEEHPAVDDEEPWSPLRYPTV